MSKRTWLIALALAIGVTYLEIAAVTGTWRLTKPASAQPVNESGLGKGRIYELKAVATVETETPDGRSDKCLLAPGDRIKIVRIEHAGTREHTVTVSYAPVTPIRPFDDRRCPAGTIVTFTEMSVEQLIEMRGSEQ